MKAVKSICINNSLFLSQLADVYMSGVDYVFSYLFILNLF